MTWAAPAWLLLLLLLAIALALLGWRRGAVALRRMLWPAVLLALISVALAGPQLAGEQRARHLALVVDLSPSMLARTSVEELAEHGAQEVAELSAVDRISVITAGRTPRLLLAEKPRGEWGEEANPWRERLREALATAAATTAREPGTDLAAALQTALAARPPELPGGILLLTDGGHTGSQASLEAARLAANEAGVALEARLVGTASLPNVALREGEAPSQVPTGRRYRLHATLEVSAGEETIEPPVTVTLWAGGRGGRTLGAARLTLTHHGREIAPLEGAPKTWRLPPGTYRLRVDAPAQHEPGFVPHEIRIRQVEPPQANAVQADDTLSLGTIIAEETVTLLTPDGELDTFGRWLQQVRPSLELRALSPRDAALPQHPADFLGTGAWILAGVHREDFSSAREFAAFDAALAQAVRRHGLRMLMLGGPRAFGPGGYIDTHIDEVLPVDCDPNRDVAAALTFVLDTSGSMAEGDRMARAAEAGVRLLERLSEQDVLALVRFDHAPQLVPLPEARAAGFAPASEETRHHIVAELDRLTQERYLLRGETDLYEALRDGVERLAQREEPAKLLLMLTDGEPTVGQHLTYDAAFEELVARARAEEIVLTVLATEPVDAPPVDGVYSVLAGLRRASLVDPELGTVERVEDLAELPQVFVDQLAEARGPLLAELREAPGYPVLDARGEPLGPHVKRYARTKLEERGQARATLWYPEEEPLLAEWHIGAGYTAALMLPFEQLDMLGAAWDKVLREPESEVVPQNGSSAEADSSSNPVREALLSMLDRLTAPAPEVPFATTLEPDEAGEPQLVVRLAPELIEAKTRRTWAESPGFTLQLEGEAQDRGAQRWRIPARSPSRFVRPLPEPLRERLSFVSVRAPDGGAQELVVLSPPLPPEWRELAVDRTALERLTTAPAGIHAWLAERAPRRGEPVPLAPWLILLAVGALLADAAARLGRRRRG